MDNIRIDYDDESTSSDIEENNVSVNLDRAKEAAIERAALARREDKAVKLLRIIAVSVLLLTALVVSLGVYFYTAKDQNDRYEAKFASSSLKITESFQSAFANTFVALDSLSSSITSYAISSGSNFPNITIPNFEVSGESARVISGCSSLWWYPLVTKETRAGWEEYSRNNQNFSKLAAQSEIELRKNQDVQLGLVSNESALDAALLADYPFIPFIFEMGPNNSIQPAADEGPFLPTWQTSPILPAALGGRNYNFLSRPDTRAMVEKTLSSQKIVVGPMVVVTQELDLDVSAQILALNQFRHNHEKFQSDALSWGGYPVFDSFGTNRTMAGFIGFTIYWKLLFADILPPGEEGYVCVVTAENQSFTYRLDGKNVKLMGPGDLHDPKYENLHATANTISLFNDASNAKKLSYTTVPIADDYVTYSITIYPSAELSSTYVNDDPIYFMLGVLSIFVFTSTVFLAYDCYVAKRQKIVMSRAVASSAIVSSLFPSSIRDRLYEENEALSENQISNNGSLSNSLYNGMNQKLERCRETNRHLADVFPAVTVFFADIVGFTVWSATRDPCDVFDLLEALYGEFDMLAQKRKVFKIETIGDCYVAVTGIPYAQPDHAIRMVRFAHDCMMRAAHTTSALAGRLGDDTTALQMRIGLHSGSVTAGVLRGTKGRFQLFGDTVNTASRMESHGVSGRIHVTQTTAEEIISKGKENWVIPREEKIVVKGKGEMQTYFINVPGCVSTTIQSMKDDTITFEEADTEKNESVIQNPANRNCDTITREPSTTSLVVGETTEL